MNIGWIKSYRKAQDHEIWKDKNAWRVFQWILWNVDYITGKKTFGRKQISEGTGLKQSTVYKVTTRLHEKWQAIGIKSNKNFTEISVPNWARYQQVDEKVTTPSREKEQGAVAESNTSKEYKNIRIKNNVRETSLEGSIEYLTNIPVKDVEEFTKKFVCTETQVRQKGESLVDYCRSHRKKYSDYKAFLRNSIRKDFSLRGLSPVFAPDLPTEVNIEGLAKLREMKEKILGKSHMVH